MKEDGRKRKGMPQDDLILELKNGARADARHVLAEWYLLQRNLYYHPREFAALVTICKAQGPAEDANESRALPKESVEYLKSADLLLQDGTVRPIVRDVVASGYQLTPDGPVLTSPFAFANEQERLIVEGLENQMARRIRRWMRDAPRDHDDDEPRSR